MAISSAKFCLPPEAACTRGHGYVRGWFTIKYTGAFWVVPCLIPLHLQAEICFACNDEQLQASLPLSAGHVLRLAIASTPTAFIRYLKDLQSIEFSIKDLSGSKDESFASCVLSLDRVEFNAPQTVSLPVHTSNGSFLGQIDILVEAYLTSMTVECTAQSEVVPHVAPTSLNGCAATRAEALLDQLEVDVENAAATRRYPSNQICDLLPLAYAAIQRC